MIVEELAHEVIDSSIMGQFIASDEDWTLGTLWEKVKVLLQAEFAESVGTFRCD